MDGDDFILERYRLQLPYLSSYLLVYINRNYHHNTSFQQHLQYLIQSLITCSCSLNSRFTHIFGSPTYERNGAKTKVLAFDNLLLVKRATIQSLQHENYIGQHLNTITSIPTFRKVYTLLSSLSPDCLYCQFIPQSSTLTNVMHTLTAGELISCFLQIFNAVELANRKFKYRHQNLVAHHVLVTRQHDFLKIPYYSANGKTYTHQTNIIVYIIDYSTSEINSDITPSDIQTLLRNCLTIKSSPIHTTIINHLLEYNGAQDNFLQYFELHYYRHIQLYQYVPSMELTFFDFWKLITHEVPEWTLLEYYYALHDLYDAKYLDDESRQVIAHRYARYYNIRENINQDLLTLDMWYQEMQSLIKTMVNSDINKSPKLHIQENGITMMNYLNTLVKYKRLYRTTSEYVTALQYITTIYPYYKITQSVKKLQTKSQFLTKSVQNVNEQYQKILEYIRLHARNMSNAKKSYWSTDIYNILQNL